MSRPGPLKREPVNMGMAGEEGFARIEKKGREPDPKAEAKAKAAAHHARWSRRILQVEGVTPEAAVRGFHVGQRFKSLSQAAKAVGVPQPTISQHIMRHGPVVDVRGVTLRLTGARIYQPSAHVTPDSEDKWRLYLEEPSRGIPFKVWRVTARAPKLLGVRCPEVGHVYRGVAELAEALRIHPTRLAQRIWKEGSAYEDSSLLIKSLVVRFPRRPADWPR